MRFSVFKKTKELESQIDKFLDTIEGAAIEFEQGLKFYLKGELTEFENRVKTVDMMEKTADELRRDVENRLYTEMIMPQARGDILALLENSDDVMNILSDSIVEFSVELPEFPEEIKGSMAELIEASKNAVSEMIMAVRSYFKNAATLRDHITKTMFYEKETDKIGESIKRKVFKSEDLRLSHKIQISYFVKMIQSIADLAEDVCDRVTIYAIKRTT